MAFDKKLYKQMKTWMHKCIKHSPMYIDVFYKQLPTVIYDENYEIAQAIKDVLMQTVNKYCKDGSPVNGDTLLKIPEYKQPKQIYCHLSFIGKDNYI